MERPGADELELALGQLRSVDPAELGDAAARFQGRIEAFLVEHGPVALTRACLPGHLTASLLLWDQGGTRVLMHHHRKLDRWLQFGGHCDGDGDTRAVAVRETLEESGIAPMAVSPRPVDFDVHAIPARPGEPEHLHLDVRFLARAPEGATPVLSQESKELAWFTDAEARAAGIDASLARLLDLGPPRPGEP